MNDKEYYDLDWDEQEKLKEHSMEMMERITGCPLPFYGATENHFKIGNDIFEVIEDKDDGYRSCLGAIIKTGQGKLIFYDTPLDTVKLIEISKYTDEYGDIDEHFVGYQIVSVKDGHSWLIFGTANNNDYYPYFVFHYNPRSL